MRRKDRETTAEEAIAILGKGIYGTLSLVDKDGMPYSVPMNYAYKNGRIYFHAAKGCGMKRECILSSGHAVFSVVAEAEIIPDQFTAKYESAIASGRIAIMGDDKEEALIALVEKYSPMAPGIDYIKKYMNAVDCYELVIDSVTGKAHR